jgi:hypothetical protein
MASAKNIRFQKAKVLRKNEVGSAGFKLEGWIPPFGLWSWRDSPSCPGSKHLRIPARIRRGAKESQFKTLFRHYFGLRAIP